MPGYSAAAHRHLQAHIQAPVNDENHPPDQQDRPLVQLVPPVQNQLPVLAALRGVAITLVFFHHVLAPVWGQDQLAWGRVFRKWPDEPGLLWFFPLMLGWIGASAFFVLSGFGIHYSTLISHRSFGMRRYLARRFWRIYPPYLVALIVFSLLGVFPVTKLSLITHLLLVQNMSGQTFYGINPSFWSLATEVQLYLIYPLLLIFRRRLSMFHVLIGALGLALITRTFIFVFRFQDNNLFDDSHRMIWASLPITLFDWTLGAYLAEQFAAGKRIFPRGKLIIIALAVFTLSSTLIRPLSMFSMQIASVLVAVITERLLGLSCRKLPPTNVHCVNASPVNGALGNRIERGLIVIGLSSYSLYLFHQPLLTLMLQGAARAVTANRYYLTLVAGPMAFIILLTLSWCLRHTLEKASSCLGRKFQNACN